MVDTAKETGATLAWRLGNGFHDESAREIAGRLIEHGHDHTDMVALGLAGLIHAVLNMDITVPVEIDMEDTGRALNRMVDRLDDVAKALNR